VVILGACVGLAVVSAAAGGGIGFIGMLLIAATLWFVALRRGAWQLTGWPGTFWLCVVGVIGVAALGSNAVSHTVLAARGEVVEVTVLAQGPADANGDRTYSLFRASDQSLLPDTLETEQELDEDTTITLLVDPRGFVPPMFPEDIEGITVMIIPVAGVGLLAITVIGSGFPLGDRRYRTEELDSDQE
jgi:hypothetical protein